MKKTRVLAVLLCVMMVMTILPAWQVSADETTYESIDQIVGETMYAEKTFDMTNKDYQAGGGFVFKPQGDHTTENGAPIDSSLEGGGGFWRYNNSTASWSPLTVGSRVAYFQAKVTEGQLLEVLVQSPAGGTEYGSFQISPTAFGENNYTNLDFAREGGAGTGFVEYLLVAETETKVHLYAKGLTDDGKWVLAATASGYSKSDNANMGLYFAGNGYLKKVVLYTDIEPEGGGGGNTSGTPGTESVYDTLDDIAGKELGIQKIYDLTQSVAGQDSNLTTDQLTYSAENGTTLNGGYFRLIQASNWSPIAEGRLTTFKAKVADSTNTLQVLWLGPNGAPDRASVLITASGLAQAEGALTNNSGFAPGTDWVEYALKAESNEAWILYAKNASTDNKWLEIAKGTYGSNGGASTGVYFSGQGHILSATVYQSAPDSYDTIDQIVGKTMYVQKTYNLTQSIAGQDSNLTTDQLTYSAENGMTLNGGYGRLIQSSGWSPIADGRVATFKAKVADSTDSLRVFWLGAAGVPSRAAVDITASGITTVAGEGAHTYARVFAPGTDWTEYAVVSEADDAWALYAKNASTNNKWILVNKGGYGVNAGASTGLYFSGQGHILSAIIYQDTEPEGGEGGGEGGEGGDTPPPIVPPATGAYDSIKAVTGRNMALDIGFDMRKDNFTSGGASYMLTTQLTYDSTNGMGLNGGYWRYTPINHYMPITVGDKVAFFRGKVANTSAEYSVLFQGPAGGNARSYIGIKSNAIRVAEGAMHYKNASFTPGTDWTDYLLVADTEESWTMYALNASTGYKWTAVLQGGYGNSGGAFTGLYFTGTGYIKEAGIYKNGISTEAGATYTPAELFGDDILEEYKKLTFDNNFDGAAENAGAKNVSTGADLAPYTIGDNGLELKNTGTNEYFAWNYGTTNSWMPLGERTPVAFRAKMDSGAELGVQIGGGESASILLTPGGVKVDGVLGMTSSFAPGTDWMNYLLLTDGATLKLYARGDNETNWTLAAAPERFSLGGYYGILLSNTKSATTYVSSLEQERFARPTLTDRATIYSLSGKNHLDVTEPESVVDMTTVDPRGTWYLRAKVTLSGAEGISGAIRNNGKQVSWILTPTSIAVGAEGSEVSRPVELAIGEQHDILFVYSYNTSLSVYLRKAGNTEWVKTHEAVATTLASGMDDLLLNETAGNVDELQIYTGDFFKVRTMALGGGNFRIAGEYLSGTSDSLYKRVANVIAVAYDKTYGYTSFVGAKDYEVEGGVVLEIDEAFPAAGITSATDDLGVMIWDSIGGGLALAEGAGTMATNVATGKPETNQAAGLTTDERYNGVRITGYTGGANVPVTASLVDANGVLRGAIQTKANADGMVDTEIAVDPALPSGSYTLMAQYGSAEPIIRQINLYGEDIPYNSINTVADMKNFLSNYGSEVVKNWNREETFAADVWNRFNDLKAGTTTFANLYEFRAVMDVATNAEVRERELCKAVNDAAKVEKWGEIQRLLMETYAADLGITDADIEGISSKKDLFLRMGSDYASADEVLAGFRTAVAAQRAAESLGGGIVGGGGTIIGGGGAAGGGGAGGGGVVGSDSKYNAYGNVDVDAEAVAGDGRAPLVDGTIEFTDLESVAWAKDSIVKLQTMRIVNGDGDGKFSPNRAVTREEFLKMAMQAAGIKANSGASVTFKDVNKGAWYYPYVAAAYEAGIINGMSEEQFGIGQQITRSDMAVILKRILDYKGILLTEIRPAFVFDDFDTIPDYARESVALLSEAGLMNGVGNNTFMGAASATRAESAVAILRIYNYIEERR